MNPIEPAEGEVFSRLPRIGTPGPTKPRKRRGIGPECRHAPTHGKHTPLIRSHTNKTAFISGGLTGHLHGSS